MNLWCVNRYLCMYVLCLLFATECVCAVLVKQIGLWRGENQCEIVKIGSEYLRLFSHY
jgi:hypothetical protein